jgi:hypothetical protein
MGYATLIVSAIEVGRPKRGEHLLPLESPPLGGHIAASIRCTGSAGPISLKAPLLQYKIDHLHANCNGDGGLVMALCPHCASVVQQMRLETMTIESADGKDRWKGTAYACPHCYKILGAELDPVAIAAEITRDVRKLLGKS